MPKFSIIIVTYNAGNKIEESLKSIINQKYIDYEIIVVDGGSDDETIKICNKYKKYISQILSENDNGIYDAFNKGIKLANGEYLFFLGAGDVLSNNILFSIKKFFDTDEPLLIYGDVFLKRSEQIYDGEFDAWKLAKRNICHQSIFYNKKIFQIVGLYNLKYKILADWEFNMRCISDRRVKLKYINAVIAIYEEGGVSDVKHDLDFNKDRIYNIFKYLGVYIGIRFIIWKFILKIKDIFEK